MELGASPCKNGEMYKPPPTNLLRAARIALGYSQEELAKLSGVSTRTIYRVETGGAQLDSILEVQGALVRAGIKFVDETELNGPGILLPKRPQ